MSVFKSVAQISVGALIPLTAYVIAGPAGAVFAAAFTYGIAKVTPGLGRPSQEERELFEEAARQERNR